MASSRLKRKIEVADQGEYGNLTESFVSIGTPLPALTENKKDKNEFKPVWEQEVYDDQGRRRLHGAFTGGFSAGYYNTVGSKEGWTPSTFKSSRSNRASNGKRDIAEAAKDFMDEEDLAELASSRSLETNKTYGVGAPPPATDYDPLLGHFGSLASTPSTNAPVPGPSFDDTLSSLLQPSSARIGLKLMRNLGWREGQGIGPRITRQQRKVQAREIGVKLPSEDEEDEEASGEAERHLYAPLDRPLVLVKGHTASTEKGWGLGYRPESTLNAQLRKEGVAPSAAGGYSVESDPYGDDDSGNLAGMGAREKKAYNVSEDLGDDDDGYRIAGSSRDRTARKSPSRPATGARSFHDGTPVLPGFSLHFDDRNLASTSQLPPPPPPGWKPDPSRLWKENRAASPRTDAKGKGKQLNADERGALLGEEGPPPVPKSVFDYLSAKSRDRLASLTQTSASSASQPSSEKGTRFIEQPPEPDAKLLVPPLDRPTALAALKGFQPYSAASTSPDPIKQARYTLYLQYQASGQASTTSSPFGPRKLPNGKMQTVEELNRELSEYAQSARVFKPVSGMLGNRFESSKSGSLDAPKIEPGLYQPAPKKSTASSSDYLASTYGDASSTTAATTPAPTLTPAQLAAREGNFGRLTRMTVQFRPVKLLCKRFGVQDPHEEGGGGANDGEPGGAFGEATATGWSTGDARTATSQPIGDFAMEQMMQSAGFKRFQEASKVVDENEPEVAKGTFETSDGGAKPTKAKTSVSRPTIETVGLGDDEAQGQEIVDEEKAPPDIFAAIFADSEDSDDEDADEDERIPEVEMVKQDVASSSRRTVPTLEEEEKVPFQPKLVDASGFTSTSLLVPPPASAPVDPPTEPLSLASISTYKPTFASSRSTIDSNTLPSSKPAKKKNSKRPVALSFDLDGEEGPDSIEAVPKKKMKPKNPALSGSKDKRGKKVRDEGAAEEEDWEEAPSLVHPSILALNEKVTSTAKPEESKKPRMRASDLY